MRVLVGPFLMLVVLLGCHVSQTPVSDNLAVWHSNKVTLQQRVEAASRLAPPGTKQAVAEEILGEPTRRERFYGPVFYAPGYVGPTNATYSDTWHDVYDLSNGDYVRVVFDMEASPSKWEDRPLLRVSSGNTNRDRLAITPLDKK
jgi:hypothetical protein